jgi:hypothetical protein
MKAAGEMTLGEIAEHHRAFNEEHAASLAKESATSLVRRLDADNRRASARRGQRTKAGLG